MFGQREVCINVGSRSASWIFTTGESRYISLYDSLLVAGLLVSKSLVRNLIALSLNFFSMISDSTTGPVALEGLALVMEGMLIKGIITVFVQHP